MLLLEPITAREHGAVEKALGVLEDMLRRGKLDQLQEGRIQSMAAMIQDRQETDDAWRDQAVGGCWSGRGGPGLHPSGSRAGHAGPDEDDQDPSRGQLAICGEGSRTGLSLNGCLRRSR